MAVHSVHHHTHLDVGDSFKVGDQVLDESLPRVETFDQDVRRAQFIPERARGPRPERSVSTRRYHVTGHSQTHGPVV